VRVSSLSLALLCYGTLISGCDFVSRRPMPANVPRGALRIPMIGKSTGWVKCSLESGDVRCVTFNINGVVIRDDVFLPYDDGPSITAAELQIVPDESSADYVWLTNGRLLLPRTDFSEHKEFAERILKPQAPR
jgi:hypothetical protein